MYRLIFQNGPWRGRQVVVRSGDLTIGRGPLCDLRIPDAELQDRHARMIAGEGRTEIEALEGAPVRVNGERRERVILAHGDRIALGGVLMEYRARGVESAQRGKRRTSPQRMTAALIILALAGQVTLMWQSRRLAGRPAETPVAEPPDPTPQEAEPAVPPADPEDTGGLEPFILFPPSSD